MPRRSLYASLAALLLLSIFLAPATTHGTTANHLLISEVLYDPAGPEPGAEFVELYNPTEQPVSLVGWSLKDNSSSDPLPEAEIGPGVFLIVAANREEFLAANPGFSGPVISLESPIGNGLNNAGDMVALVDAASTSVDAMSYGSDASAIDPPVSGTPQGQSLSRTAAAGDTDASSDWSPGVPSPGAPWVPAPDPTATPTGTPTPSPTVSPTPVTPGTPVSWPALLITEVFYDPLQSGADSLYEFVELHNPGDQSVAIGEWRLGDNSAEDALPAGDIPPGGYLVVAASRDEFLANFPSFAGNVVVLEGIIGGGLSNTGDRVKLIAPDGTVVDQMSYGSDTSAFVPPCETARVGGSLARVPSNLDTDTADDWREQTQPNPGQAGWEEVTPTPTPSPTDTPTSTPTFTPSPTPTVTVTWSRVFLSEIFYDPVQEGSDGDWEWIEIFNPTATPVTLSGWRVGDNNSEDALPEFTLAPGAHAVLAAKEAAFRSSFPTFAGQLVALEGNIGNGLSNDGDAVRLIAADGTVIDAMSYGSDRSAFDPPCPSVHAGESLVRWSPVDSDSAADWTADPAPNPGAATNVTPTPASTATPTGTRPATPAPTSTPLPPAASKVTLNEVLPDPESVDWDRDGQASFMDEWVELYNGADVSVSLEGWVIGDDSGTYKIPSGAVIWPHGFFLLYRSQTRLSLGDGRDAVTLARSDGTPADTFTYNGGPGNDHSFCRDGDGDGPWTGDCEVSPGQPNRMSPPESEPEPKPSSPSLRPTPTASVPRTVAAARAARDDTRVVITGNVTLPPGLIAKTIYVQDASGGVKVYLRTGEFGKINLGDQVRITGWTRRFYGETEISVPDPGYISVLGAGKGPAPKPIASAGLVEANEGLFVQVIGAVVKYEPHALVLKDRGGLIRVYFPESLPWRRPYVNIGQLWAAQGVLGQHADEKSADQGYQVIPRFKSDVVGAPGYLPVTGGLVPDR